MVIVYSVVSSESFHIAEEILQYLWRTGSSNEKAVILVGNKADLVRTRNVTIVGKEKRANLGAIQIIRYIVCSTKFHMKIFTF